MTVVSPNPPSDQALQFAGFVLLHCAAIADGNRSGELICPFAVLQDDQGRRVEDFESDTQEEAVERGWASLEKSRERSEWWAFGREGLYRTDDGPMDVLLVTVWTPESDQPFTVTQCFARAADNGIYLVGRPSLMVGGRSGAWSVDAWNTNQLIAGVKSHPRGAKWETWQRH